MEVHVFSTRLKTKSQKPLENMKWGQSNMLALSQNNLIYLVDILEPQKFTIISQPSNILMMEWSLVGRLLLVVTEDSKIRILQEVNSCVNDLDILGKTPIDVETCIMAKWLKQETPSFVSVCKNGNISVYQFQRWIKWNRLYTFHTGLDIHMVDVTMRDNSIDFAIMEENSCTIHIISWDLKSINHQMIIFMENFVHFYFHHGDLMIEFSDRIEKWKKDENYQFTTIMEENPLKPFPNMKEEWDEYATSPNDCLVALLHQNRISVYTCQALDIVFEIVKRPVHAFDLSDVYLYLKSHGSSLVALMTERMIRCGSDIVMKNLLMFAAPKPPFEHILTLQMRVFWWILKQLGTDRSEEEGKSHDKKFEGYATWMLRLVAFIYDNMAAHYEKKTQGFFFNKLMKKANGNVNGIGLIIIETLALLKSLAPEYASALTIAHLFMNELQSNILKYGDGPQSQSQLDSALIQLIGKHVTPMSDLKKKVHITETFTDVNYATELDLTLHMFGTFGNGIEPTLDCISKEKISSHTLRKCRFCGAQTNYTLDPNGIAMKWKSCCLLCHGLWKRV